ncbi:hypothetical protein QRO11_02885 [Paracidovorax citrulli]|uniref:Uncharacterized protein n=1 Tax=Paracidovorax citrulli TaxID=80869 RepID=A0ABY9ARI4_PARCI|nr:hypothetical protein [Paracidovorax citrulli]MVT37460.1 hypothetical protein [Paracidovorax citrulli]PVY64261.1 hypothetical protein C8E08_1574 [Paracidovorax citrulli]QCX10176.1 hypothetical protein APS58_1273 [Paracidovorax citrulli]REG71537.1 hypothetical protein C8E07_4793 [Paracidovorax citrulli]RLJ96090.1 hypothetical protein C8E06_4788 [Paracidovorax citrulli]
MTAYPDESLRIQGRAAGGVGLQANRRAMESVYAGGFSGPRRVKELPMPE